MLLTTAYYHVATNSLKNLTARLEQEARSSQPSAQLNHGLETPGTDITGEFCLSHQLYSTALPDSNCFYLEEHRLIKAPAELPLGLEGSGRGHTRGVQAALGLGHAAARQSYGRTYVDGCTALQRSRV